MALKRGGMIGEVHNVHWRELAEMVRRGPGMVDSIITDCPYSERTHSGQPDPGDDGTHRRPLAYHCWTAEDVAGFVSLWAPLTRGWFVTITDSDLAGPWRDALDASGRLTFQPLPLVERGMTVRKTGDGPSSWATWAIVARPRGGEWVRWGTLDGAYVGNQERKTVVGGKPLWMMEALVRDYTRPGDLVCDPCCGAGTTLLAAKLLGRRWVGSDIDAHHAELARERLRDLPTHPDKRGTLSLFGDR
jgi:hypothetical protein